jgi:ABC-2 type transport system ATP-binding protein
VLVSSHLLGEVEQMCTRVGVIQKGRFVAEGTIGELRGEATLTVRAEPAEAAMKVLSAAAGAENVRREDSGAFNVKVDLKRTAEINRQLVQAGVDVTQLTPSERSLEDVFIELTGAESGL